MVPHRLFQRVGIDACPRASRVPSRRERVRASALVVAMARPAVCCCRAESVDAQPAGAALQQAAQQVIVLLVPAKGHGGVAGQLGPGSVPGLLVDQHRHRDGDPLLRWARAPAGPFSAAACPQAGLLGRHVFVAVGVGRAGVDRIGQDVVCHGTRPPRPARPGEPRPGVHPCDAPADGFPSHEPSVDLAHHVSFRLVDDQPRGQGAAPRLVPVPVRGLGAEDMPVSCFLQFAAAEPLRQHRTLILGNGALDLQQELVVGVVGDRVVQEHHLAVRAAELLEQQDLVGILARQPVRAEHRHGIDRSVTDGVPQAVQPWPVQP